MASKKISLILLLSLLSFYSEIVKSQNCNCPPNVCCSQFGYCGTTAAHCSPTCRSGPCRGSGIRHLVLMLLVTLWHKDSLTASLTKPVMVAPEKDSIPVTLSLTPPLLSLALLILLLNVKLQPCLLISLTRLDVRIFFRFYVLFFYISRIFLG